MPAAPGVRRARCARLAKLQPEDCKPPIALSSAETARSGADRTGRAFPCARKRRLRESTVTTTRLRARRASSRWEELAFDIGSKATVSRASWSVPASATPECSRRTCPGTCSWSSSTCGTSSIHANFPRRIHRSTSIKSPSTLYADDIEQVRQALGLGDVVVIGHPSTPPSRSRVCPPVSGARPRRGPDRRVRWHGKETRRATDALWEAASDERKELLGLKMAELTPELRASISPAEFFVRQYVARGPWFWYDPSATASWLWEDVVPDMPVFDSTGGAARPV